MRYIKKSIMYLQINKMCEENFLNVFIDVSIINEDKEKNLEEFQTINFHYFMLSYGLKSNDYVLCLNYYNPDSDDIIVDERNNENEDIRNNFVIRYISDISHFISKKPVKVFNVFGDIKLECFTVSELFDSSMYFNQD